MKRIAFFFYILLTLSYCFSENKKTSTFYDVDFGATKETALAEIKKSKNYKYEWDDAISIAAKPKKNKNSDFELNEIQYYYNRDGYIQKIEATYKTKYSDFKQKLLNALICLYLKNNNFRITSAEFIEDELFSIDLVNSIDFVDVTLRISNITGDIIETIEKTNMSSSNYCSH